MPEKKTPKLDSAQTQRPPPDTARALHELTESREWLRVTLSTIGDGVIAIDPHGKITMLNPIAQQLTGWTQEQAVGMYLERVFHIVNQETRAVVENPARQALNLGVIVDTLATHTILIARDGTERNIDNSAAPIKRDTGEVAGAALVFRDITERDRQEKLVRDGRAYAENILHTLRHAFLVLDKDLRVVSANRSFYKRFQVEPEQTEGRLVYELGDGQWNIPKLRELLEEVLPQNGHKIEDFEVEHKFPEIGRKVMSLNARRVNMLGNHSELILLVIEDITEQRAMQEGLRDSEVRYRRLFQTAKDGILILDAHTGKITDANAFMGGLVGIEAHELLGKELHEIGMFSDAEASKQAFRTLQENKYLRYEHLPVQNQQGGTVAVEVVANIYHEDHTLVAQCNVRDISQRVVMENKIKQQAEQLAGESLRKDEFLAMLSHELRNPLAPIRSAVHLMRTQERGSENPIQQQAREIIERQVANLTKIISDILEVSRVVNGRIRLDLQLVDLRQVVAHAVETTAALFEQRGHALTVHPSAALGEVWVSADVTRLEQVIINLLTNAAKYTPDGGTIDVWIEHPEDTNVAQVRVRDTGVGIAEDLLEGGRLFDLFSQADRSLARSAGGLGVGLSIAHRLVALHGGTIDAQSPPQGSAVGTEFIVQFPRVAMPIAPDADEPPGAETGTPEGVRVLVVDDNIDQVMMLASTLRHEGYSVQTAYTGPEGLRIALQWRPDLLLLDIGLPGLDGYEVTRRLRSEPTMGNAGFRIRIIALTGYGRDTDIALAHEAGFDGHLIKPVEFKDLKKMMAAPARDANPASLV